LNSLLAAQEFRMCGYRITINSFDVGKIEEIVVILCVNRKKIILTHHSSMILNLW
jgi:hypothetical protein